MGETFQVGKATVAVRCAPAVRNCRLLHLLIDDDIPSAIADETLPLSYRQRLKTAWQDSAAGSELEKIEQVVVPSDALGEIYRKKGKQVIRIDPYWPIPKAYPDQIQLKGKRVEVAFLGTGSHAGDMEPLKDALEDPSRDWIFHHFLGPHTPEWLQDLPDVVSRKPLSWKAYRSGLGRLRFDICVYPSLDTAVNRARSCNKFLEHAMTGTLALYGSDVPFVDKVTAVDSSLVVAEKDWREIIGRFATDPVGRDILARRSHAAARILAEKSRIRQMEIWKKLAS